MILRTYNTIENVKKTVNISETLTTWPKNRNSLSCIKDTELLNQITIHISKGQIAQTLNQGTFLSQTVGRWIEGELWFV